MPDQTGVYSRHRPKVPKHLNRVRRHLVRVITEQDKSAPRLQQSGARRFEKLIRQCLNSKCATAGRYVHRLVLECGYGQDVFLSNLLVRMYGECNLADEAEAVFDNVNAKNVYSWTTMVSVYARLGYLSSARRIFSQMPERNVVSWNSMISGYARNKNVLEARSMFDKMPRWDRISWNEMMDVYGRNGQVQEARRIFECIPDRDIYSWNTMITACAQIGDVDEARNLFDSMPKPNVVSWTAIVAGYANHGHLQDARNMFDRMQNKDAISWNTMLAAYTRQGLLLEARYLFEDMPDKDVVSWNTMVAAYARHGHLENAESLFKEMPRKDKFSWNSMIAAHVQAGKLESAKSMFDGMLNRDVTSWNSMIAAYARCGEYKQALNFYRDMNREGVTPDAITLMIILDACASSAAFSDGVVIYEELVGTILETDVAVCTARINMHGKCGNVGGARNIFNALTNPDKLSWNAMMACHSRNGQAKTGLELFPEMLVNGCDPDEITFVGVLCACSHVGLLSTGRSHFLSMHEDYCVNVSPEHYMCMIDILSRAGQLDKAHDLIKSMPFEPDVVVWRTVLASYGTMEENNSCNSIFSKIDSTLVQE